MGNRYRINGLESPPSTDPSVWYQQPSGIWAPTEGTFGDGKAPLGTTVPDVAWGDAGGGGGGGGALVLLESHTATNASTNLDFTTRNASGQSGATFQTDYEQYMLDVVGLLQTTNGNGINIRFSTNGGSSFDASALYPGRWFFFYSGGTNNGDPGNTGPLLAGAMSNSATFGGLFGSYRFFRPTSTTAYKHFTGRGQYQDSNANALLNIDVACRYENTAAVNAFRLFSASNLVSGVARLYGVAK